MPSTRSSSAGAPHQRLQAWTACHELALSVYRTTLSWPEEEGQVLAEFARDAARKATLSIMIGAREPPRAFRRHLEEAAGKLARLSAILTIARDAELFSADGFTELEIQRDHAERLTRGLWRAVGRPNEAVG